MVRDLSTEAASVLCKHLHARLPDIFTARFPRPDHRGLLIARR
jgi:hypothetical protein